MTRRGRFPVFFLGALAFLAARECPIHGQVTNSGKNPPLVRSAKSGAWSDPSTWEGRKVPASAARVQVREGHTVVYDVSDGPSIRVVHVAGTLTFARDRDTLLEVGLLKIQPGEDASEDGFDCDAHLPEINPDRDRPALEVGTPGNPIKAGCTARIRLTYFPGMDKKSLPALVACTGRMDLHGAPLNRTWLHLGNDARKGEQVVILSEEVTGWKKGDRILISTTQGQGHLSGSRRPGRGNVPSQTEVRFVKDTDGKTVTLDRPLAFDHKGTGDYRGVVANLSRNVVIESAEPQGQRGHTMYHRDSDGSISYAEFRHLGKEGVLGRYSIHYHLVGNTMRGSYVKGASIWDSHNRWVTIHGTNYLIVQDCVGFQSVGHGFFLEDGTEIGNVLDHNLAMQAFVGKPLPDQVLPFDANDGAGFWWSNSRNSFTRNVACENDRYGFRYEATPTARFPLNLLVQQPDGTKKRVDIRTLPFVRFEDNESFCDGKYGLNLGEGVNRVGPDGQHPFIVKNFKTWDEYYAFRPQVPNLLVEGLNIWNAAYGIYHPNFDNHVYRNLYLDDARDEPFNRGHDDDSIQYGSLTVDGLTFANHRNDDIPFIQISDNNPSGRAESHFRNVKVIRGPEGQDRVLVNLGGGNRPEPVTATSVPVFLHDWFSPGKHAKIISVRDVGGDRLRYGTSPLVTGDGSRVAEVQGVLFPRLLDPVDDLPPMSVITHVSSPGTGKLLIRGHASDNGRITAVRINDQPAKATASNFSEWEVELSGLTRGSQRLAAVAVDEAGNREMTPHRMTVYLPR